MSEALEHFLQMEASGWKGRQGTALLCSAADAAFARTAVGALADQGSACIHALTLDRRPVSMQIVLRAGPAAFTWKIAYDETLHDVSPGMLLLEDYTAAFLNDPTIAFVNSCTYDDSELHVGLDRTRGDRESLDRRAARRIGLVFELLWRLQKSLLRTARHGQERLSEAAPGAATETERMMPAQSPSMPTRQTDVAIVGGGLAGSMAAAMLGRAGIDAVLIDPHAVYPEDFRCEKLDGSPGADP